MVASENEFLRGEGGLDRSSEVNFWYELGALFSVIYGRRAQHARRNGVITLAIVLAVIAIGAYLANRPQTYQPFAWATVQVPRGWAQIPSEPSGGDNGVEYVPQEYAENCRVPTPVYNSSGEVIDYDKNIPDLSISVGFHSDGKSESDLLRYYEELRPLDSSSHWTEPSWTTVSGFRALTYEKQEEGYGEIVAEVLIGNTEVGIVLTSFDGLSDMERDAFRSFIASIELRDTPQLQAYGHSAAAATPQAAGGSSREAADPAATSKDPADADSGGASSSAVFKGMRFNLIIASTSQSESDAQNQATRLNTEYMAAYETSEGPFVVDKSSHYEGLAPDGFVVFMNSGFMDAAAAREEAGIGLEDLSIPYADIQVRLVRKLCGDRTVTDIWEE